MDEVCKRFPSLIEIIFNNLDDQSLAKSKEATREINTVLKNEGFFWIRIIRNYARRCTRFKNAWMEVLNKIPFNIAKELVLAVQQFYKIYPKMAELSPLHVVANKGIIFKIKRFFIFEQILTKLLLSNQN